jgi:type IV pilus biogenesis protein CpaD/CtpE
MPRLHNVKRETFAQAVAADMSLGDAYEHAGFVRRRGNPKRLARHPKVAARIAELQSHVSPADLTNLLHLQAKVFEIGSQIPGAAGNRDAASRFANDLRRIATALDQHAGKIVPVAVQSDDRGGQQAGAPMQLGQPQPQPPVPSAPSQTGVN